MSDPAGPHHVPVMVDQVLECLRINEGRKFVDCTVGEGGHAAAIMDAANPDARLLGIDLDPDALKAAEERLGAYSDRVTLVHGSYTGLATIAAEREMSPADGVLLDLGISSLQLEEPERGFSFAREGRLDMRFDQGQPETAHQIVNHYSERELADLIFEFGEERKSRRIARAIVHNRPIDTTTELAEVVRRAVGRTGRQTLHPATRTFQALRIAVNDELNNVHWGINQAIGVLAGGGRLVVIAYQSLEDRVVKRVLGQESSMCICPPETPVCSCGHEARVSLVSRRVIKPSRDEVLSNPRSRSARIRVAERITA